MRHHLTAIAVLGVLALGSAPAAAAEPPPGADVIDAYPEAHGHFTANGPDDFYWVYFRTPSGWHCGIGPNGGPVGCDAVSTQAPEGANQTVVNSWGPAEYRHSDTALFTRDVDVLPAGQRLGNWGASCGVGHQGTVTCKTYGSHGFVLAANYGVFW